MTLAVLHYGLSIVMVYCALRSSSYGCSLIMELIKRPTLEECKRFDVGRTAKCCVITVVRNRPLGFGVNLFVSAARQHMNGFIRSLTESH